MVDGHDLPVTIDASWIAAERLRAVSLLDPLFTGVELASTAADPPGDEVGALADLGLATLDGAVRVSVYVFSDWDYGQLQSGRLEAQLSSQGYEVHTVTNGALLFVGVGRDGTDETRDALGSLASAFAGWE